MPLDVVNAIIIIHFNKANLQKKFDESSAKLFGNYYQYEFALYNTNNNTGYRIFMTTFQLTCSNLLLKQESVADATPYHPYIAASAECAVIISLWARDGDIPRIWSRPTNTVCRARLKPDPHE